MDDIANMLKSTSPRNFIVVVMYMFFWGAATQVEAEIFKYMDETGKVTYSTILKEGAIDVATGGKMNEERFRIASEMEQELKESIAAEWDKENKRIASEKAKKPGIALGGENTSISHGYQEESGATKLSLKLFSNYRKSDFYTAIMKFPAQKDKYESNSEFIARRNKKIQELTKSRYLLPVESYSDYDVDQEAMKFHIKEEQSYEYPATKDEISSAVSDYKKTAYLASLSSRSSGILYEAKLKRDRLLVKGTLLATVTLANIKDIVINLSRNIAKKHGENYTVAVEGRIDIGAIPEARLIATRVFIYDKKTRSVAYVVLAE